MKKHFFLCFTLFLGMVLIGCSASVNPQKLLSSSLGASDSRQNTPRLKNLDRFEKKAFQTPDGDIMGYDFLRPIGENSESTYPLILVLSEKNHIKSYLQQKDFQTIYPTYVVIPESHSIEALSQLLTQTKAYLSLESENIFLIAEEKSTHKALALLRQFPKFFATTVLVDLPPVKIKKSQPFLENTFFLFANKNRRKVVEDMQTLDRTILNHGGKATSLTVDPKQGPVPDQVYRDSEFWLRLFQLQ